MHAVVISTLRRFCHGVLVAQCVRTAFVVGSSAGITAARASFAAPEFIALLICTARTTFHHASITAASGLSCAREKVASIVHAHRDQFIVN
jgi:tetrahydromethanopterin S-methyltransferase subunit E